MSVLIRGMKMPKNCVSCMWHHGSGVCALTGMVTNTGKDCPLVEVPTDDPGYDEWCVDCKEYDAERHCCPRFNRVIREALEEAIQNAGMDRCRWYDTCPDAEAADVQGWNQLTKKEDGNE